MKRSLSVVIPVFRSGYGLKELYTRLSEVLNKITETWEIILVDDGSNDGTFEHMISLRQKDSRVKLVRFTRNIGQHHATLCGLKRAKGDIVFTLDDDLQNQPEEIPVFLAKLDEGYDLVIGKISGSKRHGLFRNIASRIIQALVSFILGKPRSLALSSYRAMTRRVVDGMKTYEGSHVYIPALMLEAVPTDRICNVPVKHQLRAYGKTNYTLRKLFGLSSYLLINHSRMPLRFVSAWGLIVSIASMGYALFIVTSVLLQGTSASGWPSLAVLISFLSGNILFAIGILGEYIGRLIEENANAAQFPIFEEYL
ncbi:MAG: glycosyltransferase [Betaproteobacteria bacterium HGW-Betaproteobacteria-2]|nr:MAG: glycosyltransferase [Betaproteobacteria bacterium HGW-Betaproteobacteria-2]